ncbi:DUF6463 family protein [Streptoalloteichus hindustanus]|uniref:Uncharacterized protein n=1 Tax=Streptoalloteichus hindustanus TaxID=2017 RepID=A0A1M5ENC2_STRHI|nr:DUF6463 family protein [Streptoalloteichus hindustanus]SHF80591.1 hypothetical protein SAMN05444320_10555 [Streptoalloteichus hindustanus]
MNPLARWVPRLLVVTAVGHAAVALVEPNSWADILREGFVGTVVEPAGDYFARKATVWFLVGGLALFAIALLTQHVVRTTGRLPARVGWLLLAMGVPLCLVSFPATGAWALLVIGVLALVAARQPRTRPE